ncbi:MAG: hypothetical protein L3J41_15700 [Melioribacteraceae bacterium]|nr:hypothetical protein [Melioribacteraceae bacterium]
MKKLSKVVLFLIAILPVTLFAHEGHAHTDSFIGNSIHFLITNFYIVLPLLIVSYFLYRYMKSMSKAKSRL